MDYLYLISVFFGVCLEGFISIVNVGKNEVIGWLKDDRI